MGRRKSFQGERSLISSKPKRLNHKWLRSRSTTPCWTEIISPPPTSATATGLSSCSIWEVAGDDDCAQGHYRTHRTDSSGPSEPVVPCRWGHDLWQSRILQSRWKRQGSDLPQYDQRGGTTGRVKAGRDNRRGNQRKHRDRTGISRRCPWL